MPKRNLTNRVTRERLLSSLVSLMLEKNFDDITVSEIADRAEVSRMAYYRNYSGKEEILESYLDEVMEAVLISNENRRDLKTVFRDLLVQLSRHSEVTSALNRAHLGDMMLARLSVMMGKLFAVSGRNPLAAEYSQDFLAGAFYNVYIKWIKNDMRESPVALAEMCEDMINRV